MSKFTTRTTPSGVSVPEPRGSRVLFADLASQPSRSHRGDSWVNGTLTEAPQQLTEEDEIVLKRWKERDKEFDEQIAHIGDAIDKIGRPCSRTRCICNDLRRRKPISFACFLIRSQCSMHSVEFWI